MDRSARLFLCVRCREQVMPCSHCDHGQLYCSPSCSLAGRREHLGTAPSATRTAAAVGSSMRRARLAGVDINAVCAWPALALTSIK